MKVIEAIQQVDALNPNAYSVNQKIAWLSRLEAMVKRLVIDAYEGGEQIPFETLTYQTGMEKELFMPEPFDACYLHWLEAQIHYANEEADLYNGAMMLFNSMFSEFKAYYKRNHVAKGAGRFRF